MNTFYHRSALPGILKEHGSIHVVDIGAGAGKSTQLLKEAGIKVSAVDRFTSVPLDQWPSCENKQDASYWKELEQSYRASHPEVTLWNEDAVIVAGQMKEQPDVPPDAIWLDADLTFQGTRDILSAWVEALPAGSVLAGANFVREFWGGSEKNVWVNVIDGIDAVRKSCPELTEPFTTWHEDWPSWLMFKQTKQPTVEILSAATENVHWWSDLQKHHERYARHHGYHYSGRTMDELPDRNPVWLKIALLRERFEKSEAEWFFWLDADAMFWDFSRPLTRLIPPQPWEAVFPHFWKHHRDWLSSGAFFVRNCASAKTFFDEVWAQGKGGGYFSEEILMANLAPASPCRILLVDHRKFNSTPITKIWDGGRRDFIMHAAFLKNYRTGFLRDLIARAEYGLL
jgi:hypothetical protein